MKTPRHVAVFDVGKTNAKLALVDLDSLSETAVLTRPNKVLAAPPYPHFDTEGLWDFLLDGLARLHDEHSVDAISVTTHGASVALLDGRGELATPVLDYEHDGPEALREDYDALRPPFEETGSPRLSCGLNVGAQLHWLLQRDETLLARTETVLPYPQYWTQRLTGVASADPTSLGCHTDLWRPRDGRFSTVPALLGLADRIAPLRRSADILGPILPQIAKRTGLRPDTPVTCGIHDSNASLYPHLLTLAPPFSVVSTGTWVVAMAIGGLQTALDPSRDTLINVNALGEATPSAKFMGGREFETITAGRQVEPSTEDIARLLAQGCALLPAVESRSGPFPGRTASWLSDEPAQGSGLRSAAAAFYLSLMTAECLALIGHRGSILVEGALARNRAYLGMLAAATGAPTQAAGSSTGTSVGAAMLFPPAARPTPTLEAPVPPIPDAQPYLANWRRWVNR